MIILIPSSEGKNRIKRPMEIKFKNTDFIIDISGSLENNEGKKDIKKINNLLNLVKEI